MDDRIKLAEARGWTRFYIGRITEKQYGHPPGSDRGSVLPDPFTDANDDYAVLEWFIENKVKLGSWHIFQEALPDQAWKYVIGDYARAALRVLHSDD